jgi:hypothetical protein
MVISIHYQELVLISMTPNRWLQTPNHNSIQKLKPSRSQQMDKSKTMMILQKYWVLLVNGSSKYKIFHHVSEFMEWWHNQGLAPTIVVEVCKSQFCCKILTHQMDKSKLSYCRSALVMPVNGSSNWVHEMMTQSRTHFKFQWFSFRRNLVKYRRILFSFFLSYLV